MDTDTGLNAYDVHKIVADAKKYRLHLCAQKASGRQCLLQIASAVEFNGELDRVAFILQELKRRSDELEEEYAQVKEDSNVMLNYEIAFPELVDSFICDEQGGRRVNVLAFRNVEDVSKMVPLSNITKKDRLRIDLRTSAWIMGKTLKFLTFAHGAGISVGLVTGNNILIEPDQHYVLIFDWSFAQMHIDKVPSDLRCQDISQAAKAVITAFGGDLETGYFPGVDDEDFHRHTDYLVQLAHGRETRAEKAHENFYKIVDSLWKREFYPFTVHPLT